MGRKPSLRLEKGIKRNPGNDEAHAEQPTRQVVGGLVAGYGSSNSEASDSDDGLLSAFLTDIKEISTTNNTKKEQGQEQEQGKPVEEEGPKPSSPRTEEVASTAQQTPEPTNSEPFEGKRVDKTDEDHGRPKVPASSLKAEVVRDTIKSPSTESEAQVDQQVEDKSSPHLSHADILSPQVGKDEASKQDDEQEEKDRATVRAAINARQELVKQKLALLEHFEPVGDWIHPLHETKLQLKVRGEDWKAKAISDEYYMSKLDECYSNLQKFQQDLAKQVAQTSHTEAYGTQDSTGQYQWTGGEAMAAAWGTGGGVSQEWYAQQSGYTGISGTGTGAVSEVAGGFDSGTAKRVKTSTITSEHVPLPPPPPPDDDMEWEAISEKPSPNNDVKPLNLVKGTISSKKQASLAARWNHLQSEQKKAEEEEEKIEERLQEVKHARWLQQQQESGNSNFIPLGGSQTTEAVRATDWRDHVRMAREAAKRKSRS